jgi:outer membrane protein assembly factor BamE (lipoprotein component of BamABCDE complex)
MKILPSLAAVALAACASYSGYGLQPGSSTADQVQQAMGKPAMEFDNPGGGRDLIFPRGPLGTQTFIAHMDASGRLINIEPVLNEEHFYKIREGMTRDQVLRMIGPPGDTTNFGPRTGNVAYTYRFQDTWGYLSDFSVTFGPDWIVRSKIAIRIDPGDSRK